MAYDWLKASNNARTTLDTTIDSDDTSVVVASGDGSLFPSSGSFRITIWGAQYASPKDDSNMEIIEIASISTDTMTVTTRGVESTSGVAHTAGDNVALLVTAGYITEIQDNVDSNAALLDVRYKNVKTDYGAVGDGDTDDTDAFNDAIAEASSGDNVIYVPSGRYKISSALDSITANGIIILGDGDSGNGSIIEYSGTTGDIFTFDGAQYAGVRNLAFKYTSLPTAGNCIVFTGECFQCFAENVRMWNVYNGISVVSCTETKIQSVTFRYLIGLYGISFSGTVSAPSYRININDVSADNPYPNGAYGTVKSWATSTAYSEDDIVRVNSNIYQCSTAGTSAGTGTGPSTVPGTTATNAFTTEITDGTAGWKFVCQTLRWIVQDNYAYSFVLRDSALINAYDAFYTLDTAATGTSYPIWHYFSDVETDHSYNAGLNLTKGEGLYIVNSWVGSSLSNNGIVFGSNYRGEGSIVNSRIMGCWNNGILINGGEDYVIVGNVIGDNSQAGSGSYHGITIAANLNQFTITGNKIGDVLGSSGNNQGYGVFVSAGTSNTYYIMNNVMDGNVTADVFDGGTGTSKEIQDAIWVAFTPAWTNLTVGNAVNEGYYKKIGKTVFFRTKTTFGSTTSMGTTPTLTLPITKSGNLSVSTPIGQVRYFDNGASIYGGQILADGKISLFNSSATYATEAFPTSSIPFTWTTSDAIWMSATYEIA